jgi:hypothetical protein
MITLNPTLPPVPAIDASQTTTARKLEWPSELPPSEPQGQCERSRLATGSLPAESVQLLIVKWLERCEAYADKSDPRAHPTWTCLCDLRAEMARANKRQPEENVEISHDPERKTL